MTTTITKGVTVITPVSLLNYEAVVGSTNVLHRIISVASPSVSLSADTTRTGRIEALFDSKAAAWAAHTALRAPGTFTLADTDFPETDMTAVRDGAMTIRLDEVAHKLWILDIGYAEVGSS